MEPVKVGMRRDRVGRFIHLMCVLMVCEGYRLQCQQLRALIPFRQLILLVNMLTLDDLHSWG